MQRGDLMREAAEAQAPETRTQAPGAIVTREANGQRLAWATATMTPLHERMIAAMGASLGYRRWPEGSITLTISASAANAAQQAVGPEPERIDLSAGRERTFDFEIEGPSSTVPGWMIVRAQSRHASHHWTPGGAYLMPEALVAEAWRETQVIAYRRKSASGALGDMCYFTKEFLRLCLDAEGQVARPRGKVPMGHIENTRDTNAEEWGL